ncbi:MAG: hypothetical protein H8E84_08880 [Flavobacteriales bacterium]|nr:hypothetical protein [Flavobacteriales bacterium]
MKLSLKILGGCIIASSFFSCQNTDKKEATDTINFPNKDSELALLMRELFEDAENVKSQIRKGQTPAFFTEFEKLHTAQPTDTDVREDGQYTAFADVFIQSVRQLINTEEDKTKQYNKMVKRCVDCHQQICPGPIKKIRKLHIK